MFRHGSLAIQNDGGKVTPTHGSILYATASGAIGVITQIPSHIYDWLSRLEARLTQTIKSVGEIQHSLHRSCCRSPHGEQEQQPCNGFIDGDLVESFLHLNREEMAEAISDLDIVAANGLQRQATIDEVTKLVGDLKTHRGSV